MASKTLSNAGNRRPRQYLASELYEARRRKQRRNRMTDRLSVIYRTGEADKAHLLQTILDDYGIRCRVADQAITLDMSTDLRPISVYVNHDDRQFASRIVESFERHLAAARASPADPDTGFETLQLWINWPKCQRCGLIRETACPYCETVGTDFELAYQPPVDEPAEESNCEWPLLICHICSEPFQPTFIRHCARCSLDLGDGVAAPEVRFEPTLGIYSPALWGWLMILIGLVILLMLART